MSEECVWKIEIGYNWLTGCGAEFVLPDEDPTSTPSWVYCPNCGGELAFHLTFKAPPQPGD